MKATYGRSIPMTVLDARALEREEGLSKKEFFEKHGFVLLDHKTSMSEEDWIESDRNLNELNNVIFQGTDKDKYKQVTCTVELSFLAVLQYRRTIQSGIS